MLKKTVCKTIDDNSAADKKIGGGIDEILNFWAVRIYFIMNHPLVRVRFM